MHTCGCTRVPCHHSHFRHDRQSRGPHPLVVRSRTCPADGHSYLQRTRAPLHATPAPFRPRHYCSNLLITLVRLLAPLLCASPQGWELPAGLTAIPTYMATIKALPEWQATDYGEDSILAGWKRHMEHK